MNKTILLCVVLMLLGGCAGKLADLRASLGFSSAYDTAKGAFKQGLIMESRTRLLTIKKDDEDYTKAQRFLKKEVEPARLKLLRYYARKGKAEEKLGNWAKAEEAYAMAIELSQQPKELIAYKKNMNLKVRQLRFDSMYQQRQEEDNVWITWQDSGYIPPRGLFGDDVMFAKARKDVRQAVDYRIRAAWRNAQMYRDGNVPEVAWLYADSYLRMYPGDKKAQNLKNAMATALPKAFELPKDKESVAETKRIKFVYIEPTVALVRRLMKQEEWQQAQKAALELRKSGHEDADKLLEEIDAKMLTLAEDAYQKGNAVFRSENIDAAVKFWQEAVDLQPNKQVYVDSLHRGKQIQERLSALKREESDAEKKVKIKE
jgi:tetratricopeptide (TPR) repeat protein